MLLIFLIDIITPVISSTQIVCDVMCPWFLLEKIKEVYVF